MFAFDAATDGSFGLAVSSHTYAHTCSGADRFLVVAVLGETGFSDATGALITGVTYNGVAATLWGQRCQGDNGGAPTSDRWCYFWYLVAPDTGTHDVVITAPIAISAIGSVCASYTGFDSLDAVSTDFALALAANTDFPNTLTTVANNCWTILVAMDNASTAPTAGSGTTSRISSAALGLAILDSNGTVGAAGAKSLHVECTALADWAGIIGSIVPTAGGGGGGGKPTPYYAQQARQWRRSASSGLWTRR